MSRFLCHRNFGRCNRGTTIIEFAIITPVLFLLLMGIIELGLIFFTYSVLEGATNIGSRLGKTGFHGPANREELIRAEIMNRSGNYLSAADLDIDMKSYSSFGDIGQPEPCKVASCDESSPPGNYTDINGDGKWSKDQGINGPGAAGAIVLYRVTYHWSLFTPLMRDIFADPVTHKFDIEAVATVRNEENDQF